MASVAYALPINLNMSEVIIHLVSGLVFIVIAVYFLKEVSFLKFLISIFFFLLLTKFNCLTFPVYGDAASGQWMEAIWLKEHHFDYVSLSHQPGFTEGGPKVYLFSLYPTIIALLINLIPSQKVFFIFVHSISFVFMAVIVSVLRNILKMFLSSEIALWAVLLFLFLPIAQAQVEILNMEIWVLFFLMLATYFMMRKEWGRSLFFASAASFIKIYAVGVNLALVCIAVLFALFETSSKARLKAIIVAIVSLGVAFILVKAETFFFSSLWKVSKVVFGAGLKDLFGSVYAYLYIGSIFIWMMTLVRQLREKKSWRVIFESQYPWILMVLIIGGWMAVFLNSSVIFTRYWFTIAPICLAVFLFAANQLEVLKSILKPALIVFTVLALCNNYGMFYKPMDGNIHSRLERSLEYRNELKLEMRLAKTLEAKYSDSLIAAPFTIAQILAFPELGYVDKKLNVMIYEYRSQYERIKNFDGLQNLNLAQTIWVGIDTTDIRKRLEGVVSEYPISSRDEVVEKLQVGERKAVLFKGGFAVDKLRRIFEFVAQQKAKS